MPPCSPDLSAIEPAFGMIKQLPRGQACSTTDTLLKAMQSVLTAVTPTAAANFLRTRGYPLQVE